MLGEICQLSQLLLIDHVQATSRTYCQHDAQVKEIIFLELSDRILVDTCGHFLMLLV